MTKPRPNIPAHLHTIAIHGGLHVAYQYTSDQGDAVMRDVARLLNLGHEKEHLHLEFGVHGLTLYVPVEFIKPDGTWYTAVEVMAGQYDWHPGNGPVLRTQGNAYAVDGETLMVAALQDDETIDHWSWSEFIPDGDACERWGKALVIALLLQPNDIR